MENTTNLLGTQRNELQNSAKPSQSHHGFSQSSSWNNSPHNLFFKEFTLHLLRYPQTETHSVTCINMDKTG